MIIETQRYGLHPDDVAFIISCLRSGKVGIIPTDSVYAYCALSTEKSGFEHICKLKHIDPKDALMSIVCRDLSQASEFFTQWDTPTYRILNRNLPGPFTFILQSGNRAPAFLKNKRKTLGLRIPHHPAVRDIMSQLDMPLIVSSVTGSDDVVPFAADADELMMRHEKQVSFIVLDENFEQDPSTIVDMTGGEPNIIRQSRHELKW